MIYVTFIPGGNTRGKKKQASDGGSEKKKKKERKPPTRQAAAFFLHDCHHSACSWRHCGIFSHILSTSFSLFLFFTQSCSSLYIMTTLHRESLCAVRTTWLFFFFLSTCHSALQQRPEAKYDQTTEIAIFFSSSSSVRILPPPPL